MIVRSLMSLMVVASAFTGVVHAQSVPLSYTAREGQHVSRLFQVHTRVTERAADGAVRMREAARLGRVREQVLADLDGREVVHLAFDSLVFRTRDAQGPWRESASPAVPSWGQFEVDARLDVTWLGGDSTEASLLRHLLSGFPGLLLPERPAWPGRTWGQEFEVSPADVTIGATTGTDGFGLPAVVGVTVDSIVQRSRDTLVYLELDGEVVPSRVRGRGNGEVAHRGTIAGTLVWSTGWSRFVSGAMRTTLVVRTDSDDGPVEVLVQTTLRQAVQSEP
jgi:hypothetical protein